MVRTFTLHDLYTDGKMPVCTITTPGRYSTVSVIIGPTVFQCTAKQWAQMCRAYLESHAPGVPEQNTQQETEK